MTQNTTIPAPTQTYAAAYQRLNEIATRLRAPGSAATIDTLAADVRAARDAYQACKDRLDAIRREIDQEIGPADADA
ncbi:exodeoxyribonuclease VII small subunit [Lichenifustis flavocetrariae]|uniref:Uncharacterized protein n=1 Tax=Lichenifustis flavocetrariae TaxID=2949735 RepID=A0AA41Z3D5_9HYPH|nr:exodeoxyribonuclease VII small subunit [Lichenifustis flavocetrariae]MCW6512984.1 hypothetical protein [Lichenifustis flavocetrariae]